MNRTLETARLLLRPYAARDVEQFVALNSDGEVRRFIGGMITAERARALFSTFLDGSNPKGRTWAIETQEGRYYVGHAFLDVHAGDDPPEIGFILSKAHWGQGYGSEVAERILRHAFESLYCAVVVATVDEDHPASIRVLEKVGMHLESVGCDDLGRYRIYRATRADWRGPS
mgnify:CR=1 FL=1